MDWTLMAQSSAAPIAHAAQEKTPSRIERKSFGNNGA
jgi:hypothetical protein